MGNEYIPERGDLVWLDFTPQSGHEQRGKRPALVLTPKSYNAKVGLAVFCPVTGQIKGYPFEVSIPNDKKINGVILVDQIKSLDWRARHVRYIDYVSDKVLQQCNRKIKPLLLIE